MKKYTIDRIEEKFAVLEDENGEFCNVTLERLPEGAGEGDMLSFENEKFTVLSDETAKRREHIKNLRKSLFE